VQVAHRSELGYVRTRNEDATFVAAVGADAVLVAVADGMGGHPAGDVASRIAVDTIKDASGHVDGRPGDKLTEVLQIAHEAVLTAAAVEPAYGGMGTTAVLSYVTNERAYVAHVGDSRCYLVRDLEAAQLTHDHNQHGYLTQALGIPRPITPESLVVDVEAGDRLLLCTDGLSGLVPDTAIGALAGGGSVTDACDRLIDAALSAGGYDNVTVVLVEVGNFAGPG
jgi:serine/threonine protein phosphatase PrpC